MGASETTDVTQLLVDWRNGSADALEQLMPHVYDELRRRAAGYLARERADHTLQPTALVHEAFFRLVNQKDLAWQNRAHFLGVAAHVMRLILIDHARAHRAQKRGGDKKVQLDESAGWSAPKDVDIIALDEALDRLATLDARQAKVVELRFFGGLNVEETGEVIGVSPATIKREWRMAKAWLAKELS